MGLDLFGPPLSALFYPSKFEIRKPKHETHTKSKFSNVQNVTTRKEFSSVSVIWILVIRICFETGAPPAGWGVRRTNFDIRISDLHYMCASVVNQKKTDTPEEKAREYA